MTSKKLLKIILFCSLQVIVLVSLGLFLVLVCKIKQSVAIPICAGLASFFTVIVFPQIKLDNDNSKYNCFAVVLGKKYFINGVNVFDGTYKKSKTVNLFFTNNITDNIYAKKTKIDYYEVEGKTHTFEIGITDLGDDRYALFETKVKKNMRTLFQSSNLAIIQNDSERNWKTLSQDIREQENENYLYSENGIRAKIGFDENEGKDFDIRIEQLHIYPQFLYIRKEFYCWEQMKSIKNTAKTYEEASALIEKALKSYQLLSTESYEKIQSLNQTEKTDKERLEQLSIILGEYNFMGNPFLVNNHFYETLTIQILERCNGTMDRVVIANILAEILEKELQITVLYDALLELADYIKAFVL